MSIYRFFESIRSGDFITESIFFVRFFPDFFPLGVNTVGHMFPPRPKPTTQYTIHITRETEPRSLHGLHATTQATSTHRPPPTTGCLQTVQTVPSVPTAFAFALFVILLVKPRCHRVQIVESLLTFLYFLFAVLLTCITVPTAFAFALFAILLSSYLCRLDSSFYALLYFLPASSLKCTMSSNSSTMWKYFDKCDNGGSCKLCRTIVKTCGNTTNLKQHLKRKHPSININVSACKSARSESDPTPFENDEDDPSMVQSTVIFMI